MRCFGKQCSRVERSGALLWEEALVWVYAADQPLAAGEPLPLAVFPEPCVYRESAVAALGRTDRAWRIVFESSSMAGCLSAARAGFAVTVIADSQRIEGLRVLDRDDGLPELPMARFYAFAGKDSPAGSSLIEAARRAGQSRFASRGLRD